LPKPVTPVPQLTPQQLELQKRAEEYYAKAKAANLVGDHKETIQNLQLAKDT